MLGAILPDFDTSVRGIDDFLVYPLHLIAQDDGIPAARLRLEIFGRDTALSLLDGIDGIAPLLQFLYRFQRGGKIAPGNALLSPQGRLVHLLARRLCTDATEIDSLHPEGIAGAEHTAHIIDGTYIIQHHNERLLFRLLVFFNGETHHLLRSQFSCHYS